jgi:hypothetical protein
MASSPRARAGLLGLAWAVYAACGKPGHSFVDTPPPGPPPPPPGSLGQCTAPFTGLTKPMFHGDRARSGWNDREPVLTPAVVASPAVGSLWDSPPFDVLTIDGTVYAGRMYASLLYADDVPVDGTATGYDGQTLSLLFAATSNGFVYAVNAFPTACQTGAIDAGAIVWRTEVGRASANPLLDSGGGFPGIALGVLGTPAIDLGASPPRLYVAAMDASSGSPVWTVYALDLRSGALLPGWPLALTSDVVSARNTNGTAQLDPDTVTSSQRAALAVSPAGDRLYVAFGGYTDHAAGWIVAVDTGAVAVAASFCAADGAAHGVANGGIWEAGGPAVDSDGRVYVTTGNGPAEFFGRAHAWGNSFLRLDPGLALESSYTPWNYCQDDLGDTDLGGDSPILLPDLDPQATATPHLVAFGSKQGTVYLLDGDHIPGDTIARPGCAADPVTFRDAANDVSLLPPTPQAPAYCDPADPTPCGRGPLSVFGPYSDDPHANAGNNAKMRSTPARFRDASGAELLFVSGSTKSAEVSPDPVPPSVARLRVSLAPGAPAYLSVDAVDPGLAFVNPGSPVVSSDGPDGPVVWIVDQNATRTQPLLDPGTNHPVLYALDGTTLQVLFRTPDDRLAASTGTPLALGGKYVTPVVAHGAVFVGTDRVQAFGVR